MQAAVAIAATNAIEAFAAPFDGSCILRHAWYVPSVGDESGGSVAALATCGCVSDPAHPTTSTSLLWATMVIVAYRATTIKPNVHNKSKRMQKSTSGAFADASSTS